MKNYPSEGGHWYDAEGNPQYTIVGKNGKERATTLRDARKFNYYPSVTGITDIIDKPGLDNWKLNQMLMAALTLPQKPGESVDVDAFAKRVVEDSKQHAEQARQKGVLIHGKVEKWFGPEFIPATDEHFNLCVAVEFAINEHFGEPKVWSTEKTFSHPLGFGGKVDLFCEDVIIDIKTKEFGKDSLPGAYDEQLWQLSAYKFGLWLPEARAANVFVSTTEELVHIHEWTREELIRGWEDFKAILEVWKRVKKYYPIKGG